MNARADLQATEDRARSGLWFGLGAYALWGVAPIYFKLIANVGAVDIVAHRIVWSVPFLFLLLVLFGGLGQVRQSLREPRTLGVLGVTTLLIGINWLLFVYAVIGGHILAASLGYYLNPLVNVLMGRIILKERLSAMQWAAVAIAAAGVSGLAFQAFDELWISLTLAVTFATYGLLRKMAPVEATSGLAVETSLLLPVAVIWLGWRLAHGVPAFGSTGTETILLVLAGVVTTVPLILFTAAARRLRYSTLGMLQFLAPTLQFLLAVLFYGEAFTPWHTVAFGSIWLALALYVTAIIRTPKTAPPAMPPE